jgi:DNA-binding response OmpR family regulator
MMAAVLVVDDDPTVREVVITYLTKAGHAVTSAADGNEALASVASAPPELVVLDLMLPGVDGLEVCRRLRESGGDIPVIMLTAKGSVSDRVVGLELGADDYVTKPFSPRELVLRVESVLRRTAEPGPGGGPVRSGDIVVDPGSRIVTLDEVRVPMTAREFELLHHFVSHAGSVFSREELLRDVWGWSFGDDSTVTVHVRRLREKLEANPTHPVRLVTVWGVGYRWEHA